MPNRCAAFRRLACDHLLAATAAATLMAWQPFASASHIGDDLLADQQVVTASSQMLQAMTAWENAPEAVKAARLQQLVTRLQARKARLLQLLARQPELASLRLLPYDLRNRLPAAALVHIEQAQRLSGSVFAEVSGDVQRGLSSQRFFLQTDAGARLELHAADVGIAERDLHAWTGRRVSIAAERLDDHLLIKSKGDVQMLSTDTTSPSTTSSYTGSAVVQGAQKTLVIVANFNDKAVSCTPSDLTARIFGSTGATVNNNFMESSRGLVSFNGQVVGPFSIPYASTGACDYSGWATAADAAARAAGIDPSQYARVNYVTPSNATCGWTGLAYMPGRQSWVQACTATGTFSHELGHNLSFHHASTPTSEYGDGSDPMGGARVVRMNASNQVVAGWLPAGTVVDAVNGGSYALAALELASATSPQVLRVPKPDTNETYYVSMRQSAGLDSSLSTTYLNAVSVHRSTGKLSSRTTLVATLQPGQAWSDAVNGITVAHQGVSGSLATVGLTFSGSTCARSAPLISASPTSQSATLGQANSFTVTVNNQNSAACGTGTFALASALPAGLSGSLAVSSLSIAPGSSASTTLSVTVGSAVADGTYTFDVSANDAAAQATTLAHGALVVLRDTMPPSLTVTSPAPGAVLSSTRSTTLAANATDASGIQAVEFYVDGQLLARDIGTPYTASWNLRKVAKGVHGITVRAIDKAGNATENSLSVTVQ